MRTGIEVVLEAADVRAAQWRDVADNNIVGIVDELYQTDIHEAEITAGGQEAAIEAVRNSLPATGSAGIPMDELAVNAMCILEAAFEAERQIKSTTTFDRSPVYAWLSNGEGIYCVRQSCWALASMAERGWKLRHPNPDDIDESFDWEFIPEWIAAMAFIGHRDGTPPESMKAAQCREAIDIIK